MAFDVVFFVVRLRSAVFGFAAVAGFSFGLAFDVVFFVDRLREAFFGFVAAAGFSSDLGFDDAFFVVRFRVLAPDFTAVVSFFFRLDFAGEPLRDPAFGFTDASSVFSVSSNAAKGSSKSGLADLPLSVGIAHDPFHQTRVIHRSGAVGGIFVNRPLFPHGFGNFDIDTYRFGDLFCKVPLQNFHHLSIFA